MSLKVTCTSCIVTYSVPADLAGKSVRCKHCRQVFRVNADGAEELPAEVLPCDDADETEGEPVRERVQARSARVLPPSPRRGAYEPPQRRKKPLTHPARSSLFFAGWIIAGLAVLMLLLILGGAAFFLLLPRKQLPTPDSPRGQEFVGFWSGEVTGNVETWTISQGKNGLSLVCVYRRNGVEIGSYHGERFRYDEGALTFVQVYDRKPDPGWVDDVSFRVTVTGNALTFTWEKNGRGGGGVLRRQRN